MNIDKAAQKLADCMDYPWEAMPEQGRENMRNHVKAIFEAADDAPAEDVRAVVKEPEPFELKKCADGYGHAGRWCGPDYKCWLDPRDRKERNEDFETRKNAAELSAAVNAITRPTVLPEPIQDCDPGYVAGYKKCIQDVEELNK